MVHDFEYASFFSVVGSDIFSEMATSIVQRFIEAPAWELLGSCLKADLFSLAEYYNIPVSKVSVKAELMRVVGDQLVEKGVLPELLAVMRPDSDQPEMQPETRIPPGPSVNGLQGEPVAATPKAEADGTPRRGYTLPRFDSEALSLPASIGDGRVRVRVARLEIERQERERERDRQSEYNCRIEIRKMELEAEIRLRQLELEEKVTLARVQLSASSASFPPGSADSPVQQRSLSSNTENVDSCDVRKNVALVPPFRESEVDSYFGVFERIATSLKWPKPMWPLLLQCKLVGKAQEAVSALSLEDSLDYDCVKAAVLRTFQLVPEAYRQKFRNYRKGSNKTFVEYAREKEVLFDRWCAASNATNFQTLRDLIMLEEFKNCLPEKVVIYLNEQKVASVSHAAVLADEFALTHKTVFTAPRTESKKVSSGSDSQTTRPSVSPSISKGRDERVCFYCHRPGHLIAECRKLQSKQSHPSVSTPVGLVNTAPPISLEQHPCTPNRLTESSYRPFVSQGFVSLTDHENSYVPISILRDTGAAQSVILSSVLPWSEESSCGYSVLLQGIEMGHVSVPVHLVHLRSGLANGKFCVAVQPSLPVSGVTFIMGNDIAGGLVRPVLEVVVTPELSAVPELDTERSVFPACAVTRAQARKFEDDVGLADTVLAPVLDDQNVFRPSSEDDVKPRGDVTNSDKILWPVTRKELIRAQKEDSTLAKCFAAVVDGPHSDSASCYYIEDGLLMRRWVSRAETVDSWGAVFQVVVPLLYRAQVLAIAHDIPWSGHLGITKTYDRVLKHFFWPGLKTDVVLHCKTCHTCQVSGKPNHVIRPAPLHPIPVMAEPFERVIVDCVGPLPKARSGNQFLLTIMCAATRYPEAIPLRKITAKSVLSALTKFFSTFGLPKVVQSDQGSNFLSKLFTQVLKTLGIEHKVSSAYHPQSQGALERWHQTLKSMLRKYCMDTNKDWDEGVPFVLFAIRETVQESLKFSPAELVFGHTVRGPLRVLKEQMMSTACCGSRSVLDHVSNVRQRLHDACKLAREALGTTQKTMKSRYDKRAVLRSLEPGDQVLVLLPIPGSALSARFSGPYLVEKKLSDTDYVVKTPDRRRQSRVCHINMLKLYHQRERKPVLPTAVSVPVSHSATLCSDGVDEDGFVLRNLPQQCARLRNTEMLGSLPSHLSHLDPSHQADIVALIEEFPTLFSDVPSRTNVLQHDINVGSAVPIKQHAYRLNVTKRQAMRKEVDYLLENNLATHSSSPWSSPCLLVPKQDNTYRFCTDYRRVNAVTVPDSFPLPRIDDCVDTIGAATFVSKLDLLKGFWQVPLTARASEISAFVTPDSFLQYNVMPFGLRNASATFQRLVNLVLHGIPNCTAYLDDLVIPSSTWADHMRSLRQVFERLASAHLTLNLAKCEFGRATITYLGKEVGCGVVRPVANKVSAIVNFPAPKTRRELRRFLGMVGYYRGFCRNFSTVLAPLTNLVSPKVSFVWSVECQHAFDSAKALLCNSPVLAAPDFEKAFKLEVDASALGAGAVLLQEDSDGLDHPVCYFSRKFSPAQSRYSTIEQETLALLMALQYFEVYVGASMFPVEVFTDHNPLVFLNRMYNQNHRLMRWALLVQGFNLVVRHKKGSENIMADALSRA